MFIIPPFTETYYKADSEKPWSYIWLGFTVSDSIPLALDDVIYCPQAYDIFNAMKSCTTMTTGISAFLCARIWDLFYLLLNRAKAQPDYIEKALNI